MIYLMAAWPAIAVAAQMHAGYWRPSAHRRALLCKVMLLTCCSAAGQHTLSCL